MPDALHAPSGNAASESRTFKIDAGEATRLDDWVGAVGQRWDTGEKTVFAVRLCLAELFANVLEHGGGNFARDHVTVTLARRDASISVTFSDTGMPFDPTTAAVPEQGDSIESATIGGRGLMLVRAYATDLAYHHDGAANHLTFCVAAR